MLSLLIRLVMGKSYGSFWTGLVMLIAGITLTVGSYVLASSLGGVTFVFYGLIIAGVVRMILSAPTLTSERSSGYRGSLPYVTGAPGYQTGAPAVLPYASPTHMVPGRCWLCGGKVKRKATICLHCGASLGSPPQDSEIAQAAGYSVSSSSLVVPPPYRPPTAPPTTWRYQPSAPAPRGPYSPPEPPPAAYAPAERRRGSRSAPQQPRQFFTAPSRPPRPSRRESYADDPGDWDPPPPRGGRRYG